MSLARAWRAIARFSSQVEDYHERWRGYFVRLVFQKTRLEDYSAIPAVRVCRGGSGRRGAARGDQPRRAARPGGPDRGLHLPQTTSLSGGGLMRTPVLVLVLVLYGAAAALAQVVDGTVTDQTGAVLPGVTVRAVPSTGGLETTAASDRNGRYRLALPATGSFDVSFELPGFVEQHARGTRVGDTQVTLDVVRVVTSFGEQIRVAATTWTHETYPFIRSPVERGPSAWRRVTPESCGCESMVDGDEQAEPWRR